MKSSIASLSVLVLTGSALSIAAQTAKPAAAPHRAATAHKAVSSESALGGCVTLPKLSEKIPALPAGSPCAKPLYTITKRSDISLDYASPMLSPALREALDVKPITISLVYIDTKIGTGELALPNKWYTVHYTGYLPDGTKFDSSVDRGEPISFPYGQHRVIQGWDTGFEGMHVGGKRRLFVPYPLAYGDQGHPPVIPAKAELIFDVELVAQSDDQPKPKAAPAPKMEEKPATPATNGAAPTAKPETK
ncbi:FKBP-type peptidyl-prolyl cis-trans isomerase [Granulicella cerasi]|uniref:Peptidyl-prolyl cis-trans isomerase n=1 Tax=Granulicella cerasi TaxID=741063 RepID=A0ABW1ZDR7_9BACT|nr:FKBP-type peptidyl-prolyl cis-trans isomerase [Granulicella cerasi]